MECLFIFIRDFKLGRFAFSCNSAILQLHTHIHTHEPSRVEVPGLIWGISFQTVCVCVDARARALNYELKYCKVLGVCGQFISHTDISFKRPD